MEEREVMQRWHQVTLDRSLQRHQLEKLLRLHMVEASSSREEGVIQVALPSDIGYTVLYVLLTTLAVFLISLGVALLLLRLCSKQANRPTGSRRSAFPPSYDTVLRKDSEGLPTYVQACAVSLHPPPTCI